MLVLSNLEQRIEVEKAAFQHQVPYLIKANYTPSEIAQEVEKILQS